jgi:uncharacterized protein with PIN domain
MNERFLCDRNLGKLAKWLRILGYDTLFSRGNADRGFFEEAGREGRIALTRKRSLGRPGPPGRIVVVRSDRVGGQIAETLGVLSLEPDPSRRMSRCLLCNEPLEAIAKEEVKDLVPGYVYENQTGFRKCPRCGRIYWPGTHGRNVEEALRLRSPSRRP